MNDFFKDPDFKESRQYLNYRYNQPKDEIHDTSRGKIADFYHYFYKIYSKEWNQSDATVLEFGGGPSILSFIAAAPFVSRFVFSEYGPMRKEVAIWKNEDPNSFDWTNYSRYIVEDLEGRKEADAAEKRLNEVRAKLSHIVPCDFNHDPILSPDVCPSEGFDVIMCTYVLECCVSTMEDMVKGLKRLRTILKPGGFLVGIMADNLTSWLVPGGSKQPCFTITDKSDIVKMMDLAGLSLVELRHHTHSPSGVSTSNLSHEFIVRSFK